MDVVLGLIFLLVLLTVILLVSILFVGKRVITSAGVPDFMPLESECYFTHFTDDGDTKQEKFPSIKGPPSLTLSVVVPAYNEEQRLPKMLEETLTFLEKKKKKACGKFSYEVIVVDDGSKDRTSKVTLNFCRKFGSNKVRLKTLTRNRGKGGAIRQGVMVCQGRYILMADADAATKFADLEKLEDSMATLELDNADWAIACGSRAHLEKDTIAKRSLFRTLLMKGFHLAVWLLGNVDTVRDTQCGFKLFTRSAAYFTFANLHVERWAFDVELLYIAQLLGVSTSEVSVTWTEVEGSKLVPVWSWLEMGRDLFFIRLHYALNVWKIVHRPSHNTKGKKIA